MICLRLFVFIARKQGVQARKPWSYGIGSTATQNGLGVKV